MRFPLGSYYAKLQVLATFPVQIWVQSHGMGLKYNLKKEIVVGVTPNMFVSTVLLYFAERLFLWATGILIITFLLRQHVESTDVFKIAKNPSKIVQYP